MPQPYVQMFSSTNGNRIIAIWSYTVCDGHMIIRSLWRFLVGSFQEIWPYANKWMAITSIPSRRPPTYPPRSKRVFFDPLSKWCGSGMCFPLLVLTWSDFDYAHYSLRPRILVSLWKFNFLRRYNHLFSKYLNSKTNRHFLNATIAYYSLINLFFYLHFWVWIWKYGWRVKKAMTQFFCP